MSKVTIPSIQLLQWSHSLKYTETRQADNKGGELKACCSNESPEQTCKYRPHANTGVLLPCDLLAPQQPTCVHTHPQRHIFLPPPPPNSSLHQDPGRLTPPPPTPPRTPHSPLPSPLPLSPSATDHCLLSLSSTALLVWGAGRIVTLLSGPPLQPPSPANLAWPHSQSSKAPSVSPNSQGLRERERWGKKGKENKAGRKELTAGEGGKEGRERETEGEASEWVLRCLS